MADSPLRERGSRMIAEFNSIYGVFTLAHPAWRDMLETREDSPWHREENVAQHTRMALIEFDRRYRTGLTDSTQAVISLALLFHDVSKPLVKRPSKHADRPWEFSGHEVASVQYASKILFEDGVYQQAMAGGLIDLPLVYRALWIIENHLPYSLGKNKLRRLHRQVVHQIGMPEFVFTLLSDVLGRHSDNHAQSVDKVVHWISEFESMAVEPVVVIPDSPPVLYMVGHPDVMDHTKIPVQGLRYPMRDLLREGWTNEQIMADFHKLMNSDLAMKSPIIIDFPINSMAHRNMLFEPFKCTRNFLPVVGIDALSGVSKLNLPAIGMYATTAPEIILARA